MSSIDPKAVYIHFSTRVADSKSDDPDSIHYQKYGPPTSNPGGTESGRAVCATASPPQGGATRTKLSATQRLAAAQQRLVVAENQTKALASRQARAERAESDLEYLKEWRDPDSVLNDDPLCATPKDFGFFGAVSLGLGAGIMASGHVWGAAFLGIGGFFCMPPIYAAGLYFSSSKAQRNRPDDGELVQAAQEWRAASIETWNASLSVALEPHLEANSASLVMDLLGDEGIAEIAGATQAREEAAGRGEGALRLSQ